MDGGRRCQDIIINDDTVAEETQRPGAEKPGGVSVTMSQEENKKISIKMMKDNQEQDKIKTSASNQAGLPQWAPWERQITSCHCGNFHACIMPLKAISCRIAWI